MTDRLVIMKTLAPPSAKPRGKRTRILDAARRLLVRHGFQDLALDAIAREAGIAKGTLFLYFRNKEELFAAAYADLVDQLGGELEAVLESGAGGAGLVAGSVRAVLSHFERNHDFMAHYGGRLPGCGAHFSKALREKFSRNLGVVDRILRRALGRRGGAAGSADYAAFALFSLCRAAALQKQMGGDARPLPSRAREVSALLLRGIEGAR